MPEGHQTYVVHSNDALRNQTSDRSRGSSTDMDAPDGRCVLGEGAVVLIEKRTLVRDSLAQSFQQNCEGSIVAYSSVEEWLESDDERPVALVILSISGKLSDYGSGDELANLSQSANGVPVAVMSDAEDLDEIVDALDQGARGYIPTSLSFKVAIEAIRLVSAGGVYVPASSLMAAKRTPDEGNNSQRYFNGMFTARQAAVVEALRRGKANKIIAYELNMCESTVKVHVRTIMKKLKAKNRTEVAFLANGFLNGDLQLSG